MAEEIKTAQTTEESGADINADISENTEEISDEEFEESSADGEGEKKNPDAEGAGTLQTKEQNSENARRRRERERHSAEIRRAREAARQEAIIEALGGKNPYTNEEMKDSADVEEFITMRKIEKQGGDPVADFSKFRKNEERERAAASSKEAQREEWFIRDRENFAAAYPDADINKLIEDPSFKRFARGKVGNLPLSEIYGEFLELEGEYEKKAKTIAAQILANKKASPGALAGTNSADSGFFTKEQVQAMSQEEVHLNYDKIRASMQKWK